MSQSSELKRTPLLVSLAVAIVGFAVLAIYLRQFEREARGGDLVRVLAVRKDTVAQQPLDEESLVVRQLPEAYVETRHVRASEIERVLGVPVRSDLEANQTLLWSDLATGQRTFSSLSSRIPKGMRAITVEDGKRRSLGHLVRPGNRVDVLLTKAKPTQDAALVTIPLLQNLLVLAVGRSVEPMDEPARAFRSSTVTLLVSLEQASLLVQAKRGGELSLILRNENDLEIREGVAETNDADLLEIHLEQRPRRPRIERLD